MLTPGMRVILSPMVWSTWGKTRHRQQQGQQLQMVSNFSPGVAPNQIVSSLLPSIMWTRPASWQRRRWSGASCLVTRRPSLGLIFSTASPRKMQPSSCGCSWQSSDSRQMQKFMIQRHSTCSMKWATTAADSTLSGGRWLLIISIAGARQNDAVLLSVGPFTSLVRCTSRRECDRPVRNDPRTSRASMPEPDPPQAPYKFLDYFEERDRAIFFGRSEETEQLAFRIKANPVTVLYGYSGMGKTSLRDHNKMGATSRIQETNLGFTGSRLSRNSLFCR